MKYIIRDLTYANNNAVNPRKQLLFVRACLEHKYDENRSELTLNISLARCFDSIQEANLFLNNMTREWLTIVSVEDALILEIMYQ